MPHATLVGCHTAGYGMPDRSDAVGVCAGEPLLAVLQSHNALSPLLREYGTTRTAARTTTAQRRRSTEPLHSRKQSSGSVDAFSAPKTRPHALPCLYAVSGSGWHTHVTQTAREYLPTYPANGAGAASQADGAV